MLLLASGKQRLRVERSSEKAVVTYITSAPHPDDLTGFSALIVSRGSRRLVPAACNGRAIVGFVGAVF